MSNLTTILALTLALLFGYSANAQWLVSSLGGDFEGANATLNVSVGEPAAFTATDATPATFTLYAGLQNLFDNDATSTRQDLGLTEFSVVNPIDQRLMIVSETAAQVDIALYDATGKLIMSRAEVRLSTGINSLPIPDLAAGVYLLRLGQRSIRIVKQ